MGDIGGVDGRQKLDEGQAGDEDVEDKDGECPGNKGTRRQASAGRHGLVGAALQALYAAFLASGPPIQEAVASLALLRPPT